MKRVWLFCERRDSVSQRTLTTAFAKSQPLHPMKCSGLLLRIVSYTLETRHCAQCWPATPYEYIMCRLYAGGCVFTPSHAELDHFTGLTVIILGPHGVGYTKCFNRLRWRHVRATSRRARRTSPVHEALPPMCKVRLTQRSSPAVSVAVD